MGSYGPNFSTNPSILDGILGKRKMNFPNMSSIPQFGGQEESAGGIPPTPQGVEPETTTVTPPTPDQSDVKQSMWDKYKALLPAVGGLVAGAIKPDSDMVNGFLQSQVGALDNERKRRQERDDATNKMAMSILSRQYSEETMKKHPELAATRNKMAQMAVQGKPPDSKLHSKLIFEDALAKADEDKFQLNRQLEEQKKAIKQQQDMKNEEELSDYRLAQEVAKNPEKYPEGSAEWMKAQRILSGFRKNQLVEMTDQNGRTRYMDPKEVTRAETADKGLQARSEVENNRNASREKVARINASKTGQPKPTQLTEGQKDSKFAEHINKAVSTFQKPMPKDEYFRQMGWVVPTPAAAGGEVSRGGAIFGSGPVSYGQRGVVVEGKRPL
jgi:hypothetical protein